MKNLYSKKYMRLLTLPVIVLIISLVMVVPQVDIYGATSTTSTLNLTVNQNYNYANQVISQVNSERKNAGLSVLNVDSSLSETAMRRAAEIITQFSHTRPDGSTCFSANAKMNGENIAVGQISPDDVMKSWISSSGHKENILHSSFQSIGVGCVEYNGMLFWVQCFSSKKGDGISNGGEKKITQSIKILNSNISLSFSDTNDVILSFPATSEKGKLEVSSVNAGWNYAHYTVDASALNYESSNTLVATVDAGGNIIPTGVGNAIIKVSLKTAPSVSIAKKVVVNGDGSVTPMQPVSAPSKATISSLGTSSKHYVKVKWKKLKCSGYQVRYSTSKYFKSYKTITVKNGSTLSKTIYKLKKNKTYYFKVRGYNLNGTQRVYGLFSTVKKIKCK